MGISSMHPRIHENDVDGNMANMIMPNIGIYFSMNEPVKTCSFHTYFSAKSLRHRMLDMRAQ